MMEKKRLIKVFKFLLQILIAAVTSWGTASGYSATMQDPDAPSTGVVTNHPVNDLR